MDCNSSFLIHRLRIDTIHTLTKETYSSEEVDDAIQEACMRLYVNRSVFENEAHYFSWFITVANNYLKDRYRSTISHPQEMLSDIDLSQSADGMSDVLDRISTNQLLDILSNSERDILVYKAAGWSCAEIAEKLNITEENAKKRLQRARAKLHSLLEERKNG